ncbi:MAG: hypothetical protein M1277_01610 [Patescibacteria group bacterium]|nr:hypothetical protein [Patescibacteria group bacterium]
MSDRSIRIDAKTAEGIFVQIGEMEQKLKLLKKQLAKLLPPRYGSEEWWKKAEREADEDIKAGRYTTLKTEEELQSFLDSLK